MRLLLAFVMIVHGMAHLVGFAGAWHLDKQIPYKTTILHGRCDIGDRGIRMIGIAWLAVAVAFIGIGGAAMTNQTWWLPAAASAGALSLVLCLIESPDARFGAAIDAGILAALLLAPHMGVTL